MLLDLIFIFSPRVSVFKDYLRQYCLPEIVCPTALYPRSIVPLHQLDDARNVMFLLVSAPTAIPTLQTFRRMSQLDVSGAGSVGADLLEADFGTTSRVAGRHSPVRSSVTFV
jgi:hypothetical protein